MGDGLLLHELESGGFFLLKANSSFTKCLLEEGFLIVGVFLTLWGLYPIKHLEMIVSLNWNCKCKLGFEMSQSNL